MAQFRNITDEARWVVVESGTVEVLPDSILEVSDAFAELVYFQVGDHGETPIWEAVSVPKGKKSSTPTIVEQPAAAEDKE